MLEKIISLASLGGLLSSLNLTRKFVNHFAIIVALAVAGAIVAASLVVLGFGAVYMLLVHYGTNDALAALLVALMGALILFVLIACIHRKVQGLEAIPFGYGRRGGVAGSSVMALAQAFYRGLTDKKSS